MYKDLTLRLQNNFYFSLREGHYKNIKPKVLVGKLLLTEQGKIPEDYKFHCFNGVPKFVQVDVSRFSDPKRSVCDINWNLLDIACHFPKHGPVKRPDSLEEILSIAGKLASQFNYCRIDLYSVNNKVYFGEITFSPGAGFSKFHPLSVDMEWGELIDL